MIVKKFSSHQELYKLVSEIISNDYKSKNRRLRIFFPAGRTPHIVYEQMVQNKGDWSSKLEILQVDEFRNQSLFREELYAAVVKPLGLEAHFRFIDSSWTNLQMLEHVHSEIRKGIDGAILGLGPNGHIGFHEPGELDETFLGGALEISNESLARVKGAESPEVLTFGAKAFMSGSFVILIIRGDDKKEITQKFLNREPTSEIPATLLKRHSNLHVFVDGTLLYGDTSLRSG